MSDTDLLITFDIDWAPDFMIESTARLLRARNVKSTWFVTHRSAAVDRMRSHPECFELGIHPNFLPSSSHGRTPLEILTHCMSLVPDAVSMRSHGLAQSTPMFEQILNQTPIKADVSLFLPRVSGLVPFDYTWTGRTILRVPYFWEDDYEMFQKKPLWRLEPLLSAGAGLKVFNFHPVHVYLNSSDLKPYQSLKRLSKNLAGLSEDQAEPFIQKGAGAGTLLEELLDHLSGKKESLTIKDLAERRRGILG